MMVKKPNAQPLLQLIQTMTKSEKRSFKIYFGKSNDPTEAKFIRLFDVLDVMERYDEEAIFAQMPDLKRSQLANLKAHLFKQILLTMRHNHLKTDVDIQLRQNLDYVRLLYKKGLYEQSMKWLQRTKVIANHYKKNIFKLSLLNYEKNIENQQVTTLSQKTCLGIDQQTKSLMRKINVSQSFFSLALRMKAYFLRNGMARSEQEAKKISDLFHANLPEHDKTHLSFSEQYNMCRAYYWFSYITQDFDACVKYTHLWVSIFKENNLTHLRHAEFLRGLNRLLQSLFRINDRERFGIYYEELLEFEKLHAKAIDSHSKQLLMRCLTIQTLNYCFLEGDLKKYAFRIERYLAKIEAALQYVDRHNQLVIYYKVAILYFGLGKYEKSLHYLDRVIEDKNEQLREDLKSFSYILYLIVLYDMCNFERLAPMRKRAFVYLRQRNILGQFHHVILQFLKKTEHLMPLDVKGELKRLRGSIESLAKDKFEAKPLLYFDLMSWLESKISNRPLYEVVKEK